MIFCNTQRYHEFYWYIFCSVLLMDCLSGKESLIMKPNSLLRRERELRGWSQAKVWEKVGTTELIVGRWERGVSLPYPHFREKLCVLFGKDAGALGLLDG